MVAITRADTFSGSYHVLSPLWRDIGSRVVGRSYFAGGMLDNTVTTNVCAPRVGKVSCMREHKPVVIDQTARSSPRMNNWYRRRDKRSTLSSNGIPA